MGLGGEAEPLYVIRVEPETAQVVVGPKISLLRDSFAIHSLNWLAAGAGPEEGQEVQVKLRNTQPPMPARLYPDPDASGRVQVLLESPEGAVTPGQACVIYNDARVLGGGWIARATADLPHNQRRELAASATS